MSTRATTSAIVVIITETRPLVDCLWPSVSTFRYAGVGERYCQPLGGLSSCSFCEVSRGFLSRCCFPCSTRSRMSSFLRNPSNWIKCFFMASTFPTLSSAYLGSCSNVIAQACLTPVMSNAGSRICGPSTPHAVIADLEGRSSLLRRTIMIWRQDVMVANYLQGSDGLLKVAHLQPALEIKIGRPDASGAVGDKLPVLTFRRGKVAGLGRKFVLNVVTELMSHYCGRSEISGQL